MDWYVTNLIACNGYVAHLQSTKYNDVKVHNAKVSLISGIALGLNIPMLMLVEEPFEAPTYLIHTELLKSIYSDIKQYPSHWEFDNAEKDVIEFVENKKTIPDFSVRLESIMENLSGVKSNQNGSKKEYQLKVSELLHNNIINKLRSIIGSCCSKKEKIVIRIDNLDKAWQAGANLKMLSNFLFGLLGVGNSIIRDFAKESNWKKPVTVLSIKWRSEPGNGRIVLLLRISGPLGRCLVRRSIQGVVGLERIKMI